MSGQAPVRPAHAHVPGRTPRHAPGTFDAVRATARPGMDAAALARSEAFLSGLRFIDTGYYWEAHEVLEPVWMALPDGSRERRFVRGLIQIANAHLKRSMGRPKATLRLCAMARSLLPAADAGPVMGRDPGALHRGIDSLEQIARGEL